MPSSYGQNCRMQKVHSSFHFFFCLGCLLQILIVRTKVGEGRGPSLFFVAMSSLLGNIQTFLCSFAFEMLPSLFPIVAHVTTTLLLDNITSLLEIRIWLNDNFILLVDLVCSFPRTSGALEFAFTLIILLLETKRLTKWTRPSTPSHIPVKNWGKFRWFECLVL